MPARKNRPDKYTKVTQSKDRHRTTCLIQHLISEESLNPGSPHMIYQGDNDIAEKMEKDGSLVKSKDPFLMQSRPHYFCTDLFRDVYMSGPENL